MASEQLPLNSSVSPELEEIADQCPYIGGEAVFKARALLRIATDQWYWDDRTICESTLKLESTNIETQDLFDLYPNPTNSSVYFKYSFAVEGDYFVVLTDILGRKLKMVSLEGRTGETEIELSPFASGIYGFFVKSGNDIKFIGKVTLTK